jgi:hypothetical protein
MVEKYLMIKFDLRQDNHIAVTGNNWRLFLERVNGITGIKKSGEKSPLSNSI